MHKVRSAMPSFIDCLNAFVLTGVFVFLLAVGSVMAGASPPSAPTAAFVLTDQAPSGLAAPRINRLAGEAR